MQPGIPESPHSCSLPSGSHGILWNFGQPFLEGIFLTIQPKSLQVWRLSACLSSRNFPKIQPKSLQGWGLPACFSRRNFPKPQHNPVFLNSHIPAPCSQDLMEFCQTPFWWPRSQKSLTDHSWDDPLIPSLIPFPLIPISSAQSSLLGADPSVNLPDPQGIPPPARPGKLQNSRGNRQGRREGGKES